MKLVLAVILSIAFVVIGGVASYCDDIGSSSAYPYTGGCYMQLTTSYGSGVLVAPEVFRFNSFGFLKGTDRIVNLTNSTVNCYWIMNGVTYSARFQRYGELEYQYVSGSTSTWRSVTVYSLDDSNVQFLDETGERGIQRPYLSMELKILITFVFIELLVHGLALVRRR